MIRSSPCRLTKQNHGRVRRRHFDEAALDGRPFPTGVRWTNIGSVSRVLETTQGRQALFATLGPVDELRVGFDLVIVALAHFLRDIGQLAAPSALMELPRL